MTKSLILVRTSCLLFGLIVGFLLSSLQGRNSAEQEVRLNSSSTKSSIITGVAPSARRNEKVRQPAISYDEDTGRFAISVDYWFGRGYKLPAKVLNSDGELIDDFIDLFGLDDNKISAVNLVINSQLQSLAEMQLRNAKYFYHEDGSVSGVIIAPFDGSHVKNNLRKELLPLLGPYVTDAVLSDMGFAERFFGLFGKLSSVYRFVPLENGRIIVYHGYGERLESADGNLLSLRDASEEAPIWLRSLIAIQDKDPVP